MYLHLHGISTMFVIYSSQLAYLPVVCSELLAVHLYLRYHWYKVMVRTVSYSIHGMVPASSVCADRYDREDVVKSLGNDIKLKPTLKLGQLPSTADELLKLDQVFIKSELKVGVVFVKENQVTEDQILDNTSHSALFEEFLLILGDRISLREFDKYKGGLDTVHDLTGTDSVYIAWRGIEIMFHVSTLLPHEENDPQQLQRKRHIGNDIVCVIFLEANDTNFSPACIKSHFLHTFIVVRTSPTKREYPTLYEVSVVSRDEVGAFKPFIHHQSLFKKVCPKFELWRIKFLGYMRLQKLYNVMVPSADEKAPPTSEENSEAFAQLIQFLDDRSLSLIIRDAEDEGRQALQILEEHYLGKGKPRIIALYHELTSLSMDDKDSVTDYVIRAETAANSLKAAGEAVSDSLLVAMVLKGLPARFRTFSAIITQRDGQTNFCEFKVALKSFNETEKYTVQDNKVMNVKHVKEHRHRVIRCFKCNKEGHKSFECKTARKWCTNCNMKSHNTQECRRNLNSVQSASVCKTQDSDSFIFMAAENPEEVLLSNCLLVDCGATAHIITEKSKFVNFYDNFNAMNHYIELADGSRTSGIVQGKGDVEICLNDAHGSSRKVLLKNVLFVPSYKQNIFSVQAATDRGVSLKFNPHGASLEAPNGGPMFREWLLTKIVNGERASYSAPKFARMQDRTRSQMLEDIVTNLQNHAETGQIPKPYRRGSWRPIGHMRPSSPLQDSVRDSFEGYESLAKDFTKAFTLEKTPLFDIVFNVGTGKEKSKVYAARAILAVRSRVFQEMLYGITGYGTPQSAIESLGIGINPYSSTSNAARNSQSSNFLQVPQVTEPPRQKSAPNSPVVMRAFSRLGSWTSKWEWGIKRNSLNPDEGLKRWASESNCKEKNDTKTQSQQQPQVAGTTMGLSVCADAHKVDRNKLCQTEFNIIEFDCETFRLLVEYLHTGSCALKCLTVPGLICAAEHYDLPDLLQACFHHARQFMRVSTVCPMLAILENYYWRYSSAAELVTMALKFCDTRANAVFAQRNYYELTESGLQLILGRDLVDFSELNRFYIMLDWTLQKVSSGPTGKPDKSEFRCIMNRLTRDLKLNKIAPHDIIKKILPSKSIPNERILEALLEQIDSRVSKMNNSYHDFNKLPANQGKVNAEKIKTKPRIEINY
ncbi:Rap1 GTPase-activating protein 2 [Nymphon striatum]|nr:Rap1 GTPase-activating protein 2 [Nymphon striatum]